MPRAKQKKYSESDTFENIIKTKVTSRDPFELSPLWADVSVPVTKPITLELGCGKGEYTLSLARKYPDRNFIGMDIKSDRLWRGAKTALEEGLDNVLFVRGRIEHLAVFFGDTQIDEVWIPFPDPHIDQTNGKRRLTSKRYLEMYKPLLKPGARLHLKTDDDTMYGFSKWTVPDNGGTILSATPDLYSSDISEGAAVDIQTTFEKKYLQAGKTIKYLQFSLT